MPVSPRRTEPKTPRREGGSDSVRRTADIPYAVHVMGVLPADIVDRISQIHATATHAIEEQENTDSTPSKHGEA